MTEEQVEKIIFWLKSLNNSYNLAMLFIGIFAILILIEVVFTIWKYKKIKKWRNEYQKTLTDDQKKAIEENKNIRL